MKKLILLIVLIIFTPKLFSQSDYLLGHRTYCKFPDSERVKEIFPLGIECAQKNIYLGSAAQIFAEVIKIDSTFCDAYFWGGYVFRLSNMNEEAAAMYYMADSLAQNKSIEFKQNLATVSMIIGADNLARKKFEEMKEYFPESPEGFYGVALTSTVIGDVEYGLENINTAEEKHYGPNPDIQLLKAILLTLNGKFPESIPYYENVKSKFSKLDQFNGNYALSLYETGILNNDEKMLKLARKHYNKIKNKDELTNEMRNRFKK